MFTTNGYSQTFSKMSQTWTCVTCDIIMGVDAQKSHQRGKRHQTKLKAETQPSGTAISTPKRHPPSRLDGEHDPHHEKILRNARRVSKMKKEQQVAICRRWAYSGLLRRHGVGGMDKTIKMRPKSTIVTRLTPMISRSSLLPAR